MATIRRLILDRLDWYAATNAARRDDGLPPLDLEATEHFVTMVCEQCPPATPDDVRRQFAQVIADQDPTTDAYLVRLLDLLVGVRYDGVALSRDALLAWVHARRPTMPLDAITTFVDQALQRRRYPVASRQVPPRVNGTPVPEVSRVAAPAGTRDQGRPGDAFAATTTWEAILEPHGWTKLHARDGVTHWRRPEKTEGESGTTNFGGTGLLYVFSASTVFEPHQGYTKFAAYAVLNHGGDFRRAADALRAQGYGMRAGVR